MFAVNINFLNPSFSISEFPTPIHVHVQVFLRLHKLWPRRWLLNSVCAAPSTVARLKISSKLSLPCFEPVHCQQFCHKTKLLYWLIAFCISKQSIHDCKLRLLFFLPFFLQLSIYSIDCCTFIAMWSQLCCGVLL